MMNHFRVVILLLVLIVLAGCSKTLTDSSAVGTTQKFVDSQDGGTVSANMGQLGNILGREQLQPLQLPEVQRLIKEGFIQEKTVMVPYPNFSGQFSGTYGNGFGSIIYKFQFQTVASTPPHIEGTYADCITNAVCWGGSLNGTVQRNGPSTIRLVQVPQPPGETIARTLVVSLNRGQPDSIVGTLQDNSSNPFAAGPPRSIRLEGHAGADIQQEVYVYNWTDKLPKDVLQNNNLKIGHLVVDSCEHLLLGNETSATATCKTHVKLTKESAVIFGNRPTDRSMQVMFGKQPDGTWVGTNANYSPPAYAINP